MSSQYVNANMLEFAFSCSVVYSRAADAVQHFHLYWREDHFAFGHGTYDNVEELAEHFDNKPLLGGESGTFYEPLHEKTCFLHMRKNKGADQLC